MLRLFRFHRRAGGSQGRGPYLQLLERVIRSLQFRLRRVLGSPVLLQDSSLKLTCAALQELLQLLDAASPQLHDKLWRARGVRHLHPPGASQT